MESQHQFANGTAHDILIKFRPTNSVLQDTVTTCEDSLKFKHESLGSLRPQTRSHKSIPHENQLICLVFVDKAAWSSQTGAVHTESD